MLRLAASSRGGGAEPSAAPGSIKGGGGPETRSGTVQSLKCCPASRNEPRGSQVLRLAASRGGGPETRSGTVQSLKCCPASRNEPRGSQVLRLAASRGGPRNALGYRPEPEVLPLPAETSREAPKCCAWQHQGRGPRNALGRPEPEVLPLPAETSREAPKCCAWQHQEGGPRNALGHRPEPRGSQVLRLAASRGGGPKRARAPSRACEAPKCVSSVKRARAP